ncbi:MAG: hypothetical protein IJS61_06680 [Firmicutes bacterium]|nr:hypothetical protein [Bacillota bacterium]
MTLTEMKKKINSKLAEKYEYMIECGTYVFNHSNVGKFEIDAVSWNGKQKDTENFFVIEYLDLLDGGSHFYPSDYENLDKMVEDMIKEIEEPIEED